MKYLLSILLFFSLQSQAQIINASPPYRPFASAPSCSYLLDQYSGAVGAFALNKLDCDYTGYAIKVRRSSDNTESDIGFTTNGDLDTSALKTFVGANSAYGATWYSQQGSVNGVQSTTGNQPRIVNAGVIERQNGKPSLYFDGNDFFSTTSFTLTQPTTYFLASKNDGTASTLIFDGSTGDRQLMSVNTTAGNDLYAGAVLTLATNTTSFCLLTAVFNSTNSKLTRNNSSTATGNAGTMSSGNPYIGKGQSSGLVGYLSTFIIYNSDQSSNRTGIETIINTYYSIY